MAVVQDMPSVAICLATYNGQNYIAELLDSIEAQTFGEMTIVVRDDGSTDDTVAILSAFCRRSRHRTRFLQDQLGNLGPAENFKEILRQADADVLFFCDQDDVWHPRKVEHMMARIQDISPVSQHYVAFCDYDVVDAACRLQRSVKIAFDPQRAIYENQIPGCCMAISKNLVAPILNSESLGILHDWLAVLLNIRSQGVFVHIDQPLLSYRQHAANVVGASKRRSLFSAVVSARGFVATTRRVFWINQQLGTLNNIGFTSFLIRRLGMKLRGALE